MNGDLQSSGRSDRQTWAINDSGELTLEDGRWKLQMESSRHIRYTAALSRSINSSLFSGAMDFCGWLYQMYHLVGPLWRQQNYKYIVRQDLKRS